MADLNQTPNCPNAASDEDNSAEVRVLSPKGPFQKFVAFYSGSRVCNDFEKIRASYKNDRERISQ